MAAVNDKALREMNSEYRNICRKYSKFSKIETLLITNFIRNVMYWMKPNAYQKTQKL